MQFDEIGEQIDLSDGYVMIITQCTREVQSSGFGMKQYPFWYNLNGEVVAYLVIQDKEFLSIGSAKIISFIRMRMNTVTSYNIRLEEEVNKRLKLTFEIRGFMASEKSRLFKEETVELIKREKILLRKLMIEKEN